MTRLQRIVTQANSHIRANRLRRIKIAFDFAFLMGAFFGLYLFIADHYRHESYAIYVPSTDETCIVNIDGRTQAMHCRPGAPENEPPAPEGAAL